MRRLASILACALPAIAACGISDDPATADFYQASSVHLKGGANAEPTFTDLGLQLGAAGELAGLGEGDVLVNMSASANVVATCENPSGANQPPGQNPADVTVSGSSAIPADEIQNGNTPFSVTTKAPETTIIAGAPGCSNPNWTETITDLKFTGATITVYQAGALVLTVTCDFAEPTTDNTVPASNVTCTSS